MNHARHVTCSICGRNVPYWDSTLTSGGNYMCWECNDKTAECWECKEHVPCDTITKVIDKHGLNRQVCDGCLERYTKCADCGDYRYHDDVTDVGGRRLYHYVCASCLSDYAMCSDCDGYVPADDVYRTADGDEICESCYETHYFTCESCHEVRHLDDYGDEGCCSGCAPATNMDGVYEYGHEVPVRIHTTKAPIDRAPVLMGPELEMEANGLSWSNYAPVDERLAYATLDASVEAGFEIHGPAATLDWWSDGGNEWIALIGELASDGCRAHDPGTCGMHIHVDRLAGSWFSPLVRAKIWALLCSDYDTTLTISQRTEAQLEQWAPLLQHLPPAKKANGTPGRRAAFNVRPGSPKTHEFRLFRGNLRRDRILKNFEYVDAVLRFCAQVGYSGATYEPFFAYVAANRKRYGNLQAFITEKGLV